MARRSPARILAPLALVGAVVATIVVVQASTSGSGESSTATTTPSGGQRGGGADGGSRTVPADHTRTKSPARSYTVKPGDILTTVSERTGVSVQRLQELNPDLDPQALQVGQKLKLAAAAGTDQTP
jgi:LysM repeat protein